MKSFAFLSVYTKSADHELPGNLLPPPLILLEEHWGYRCMRPYPILHGSGAPNSGSHAGMDVLDLINHLPSLQKIQDSDTNSTILKGESREAV